jgi:hypothetical protein
MEPLKITLKHPVKAGDEQIDELTISRRPTAKDLRCMDQQKGEIAKMMALLERLTGVPSSVLDAMDGADFTRAAEAVSSFLS